MNILQSWYRGTDQPPEDKEISKFQIIAYRIFRRDRYGINFPRKTKSHLLFLQLPTSATICLSVSEMSKEKGFIKIYLIPPWHWAGAQAAGKEHNQDIWFELAKGIFHTVEPHAQYTTWGMLTRRGRSVLWDWLSISEHVVSNCIVYDLSFLGKLQGSANPECRAWASVLGKSPAWSLCIPSLCMCFISQDQGTSMLAVAKVLKRK